MQNNNNNNNKSLNTTRINAINLNLPQSSGLVNLSKFAPWLETTKASIKVSRRSYSKSTRSLKGVNRWGHLGKPSKAMPAPSTVRMQHLTKLAASSREAREMLNFINTMNKLNQTVSSTKKFYSSFSGNRKKSKNKIHKVNYSTSFDSGDSSKFNEGKRKKVIQNTPKSNTK